LTKADTVKEVEEETEKVKEVKEEVQEELEVRVGERGEERRIK
jgi:hypothetical protein